MKIKIILEKNDSVSDRDVWVFEIDVPGEDFYEIAGAFQKSLTTTMCAYCGHESPRGDKQAVIDHILTCDKRPEKQLLEKAFEVEQGLITDITHLSEHPYDPETCDRCQVIRETLEAYNSDKEPTGEM